VSDRLQGQIVRVGPFARYFFIQWANDNGQISDIFGSRKDVIADVIGRVNLELGASVSFALAPDLRGKGKVAVDIKNEDPALVSIDVETYREFGIIHDLQQSRGQVFGVIRRGDEEGADLLPFRASDIISDGADDIRIGDVLEFGIATHTGATGEVSYHASAICTTTDEPAPPEEAEEPQDIDQVYSAKDRKRTLRELISKRI
jgi:hypothetical protein